MSEVPKKFNQPESSTYIDIETKLNEFDAVCEYQQLKPLAEDERVSSFASAAQYALSVSPRFKDELIGIFHARPDEDVDYTFSRMIRAFQKALTSEEAQEHFKYPEEFDLPNWMNWYRGFEWVFDHPDHSDQFSFDMWTRELQSNITERYKNIKLLALLLPETFPPQPLVLDIGCSQNLGLKKLFLNRPFAHTSVVNPEVPQQETNAQTQLVNKYLERKIRLGPSIGIDKQPLFDTRVEEWAQSCSFLPSELLNPKLRAEFALLGKKRVSGVGFVEMDFLEMASATDKGGEARHKMFHFIFYSTVLYQLDDKDRKTMLKNGETVKHPKGIRVILDNALKDPTAQSGLRFNPNYAHDYEYTTHIDDPAGSGELLEVFRWKNGRCLEMKAGKDIGRLATVHGVNTHLLEAIAKSD